LALGLARALLDRGGFDPAFQSAYPEAYARFTKGLKDYDLGTVSSICGVSEEDLVEAACVLASAGPLAILYGHGLLQTSQPRELIQALIGLARARGSFGKAGGGLVPAYGSCNLQGAQDLGFTADVLAELATGKIKALYLTAEAMDPEQLDLLKPHMEKLEVVVFQGTHLPAQELAADVLLPLASLLEKEGSLTNSERRVQWTSPVFAAPEEAGTLLATLGALAERAGAKAIENDPQAVLESIGKAHPDYAGINAHRARFEPVQWPCKGPADPGSPALFADAPPPAGSWDMAAPAEPAQASVRDKAFPFAVIAKETLTAFWDGPLLAPEVASAIRSNGDIEMNPADAYSRGYQPGDTITVATRSGQIEGRLTLNKRLPAHLIAVPVQTLAASIGAEDTADQALAARVADLNAAEPTE
jgi:predicted molibdopterin-dependent oxidoreductase YjgC